MDTFWQIDCTPDIFDAFSLNLPAGEAVSFEKANAQLARMRHEPQMSVVHASYADTRLHAKILSAPTLSWVCLVDNLTSEGRAELYDLGVKYVLARDDSAQRKQQVNHQMNTWLSAQKQAKRASLRVRKWLHSLTQTQYQVLQVSAVFESAEDCARYMGISPRTVEAHRYNSVQSVQDATYRELITEYRLWCLAANKLGLITELPQPRAAKSPQTESA